MEIDQKKYPQPRTRHHTGSQVYLPLHQLHVTVANYPPLVEAVEWKEFFANGVHPRAIDIGCGWGKFLVDFAEQNQEVNILGLEARQNAADWINTVAAGENIFNAHALWYTVANGLKFLPSASLDFIFYFFPDPWFKRRHLKRRAFTTQLLDEIVRLLTPNGKLFLMTDVPEVDVYQCKLIAEHSQLDVELITDDVDWIDIRSNHELFSISKNFSYTRRICRLRDR